MSGVPVISLEVCQTAVNESAMSPQPGAFGDTMPPSPPSTGPGAPARKGFWIRGWVLVVMGAVIALAAGIAIGTAMGGHHHPRRMTGARATFATHDGGHWIGLGFFLVMITLAGAAVVVLILVVTPRRP